MCMMKMSLPHFKSQDLLFYKTYEQFLEIKLFGVLGFVSLKDKEMVSSMLMGTHKLSEMKSRVVTT